MTATPHMRAVQFDRTGGADVLELRDVPVTAPGPGEVRVRLHAIGLNFIDVYHRTGLYPLPLPSGLGGEGAGVVEAVGEGVTHVQIGDRVAYASNARGSYAQAHTLPAFFVCRLPDAIDFETGAAMMLKGLTVQYLLKRVRPVEGLEPGDFVLFHAAAGGVGLMACQWARELGLRLIGTAGSDEKCALARAHGAEHVINYRSENFAERVKDITEGQKVKVVYDSVGKDTWEGSLDCLRPFGLMATFGNASGPVPPFAPGVLAARGSLYLTRQTLFTHLSHRERVQEMADDLFDVVERGVVQVHIGQRFALDEVRRAHDTLEARATTGSSILLP